MKTEPSRGRLGVLTACVLALVACGNDAGTGPSPAAPRLRLVNTGTIPIQNLVVLFPSDEVPFGTVPPGTTTRYEAVTNGVYRYAAWRFLVADRERVQPVIDWVGESPMEGAAFTYTIEAVSDPDRGLVLQLIDVRRDD